MDARYPPEPERRAGPRPKDLFRRLDHWTQGLFEAHGGPQALHRVASLLPTELGTELGVRKARLVAADQGACDPHDPLGRRIRLEAFRQVFVLELDLDPGVSEERAELLLSALQSVLAMRIMQRSVNDTMREAAAIQQSLLPQDPPELAGYDLAVRCQPTDEVGGDLYDFLRLDQDTLGLAVGDASGHGLPAALLVRDVVVGLRMGMEKELRPEHALARLNQVIHESSLSSCFVSLLYAELESNGNLFYFNAGHEAPLLFEAHGARQLSRGDTVIGPLAQARFKRHYAHVDRGATLLVYTDGLLERRNAERELFGLERLVQAASQALGRSSRELVEHVFQTVDAFGAQGSWEDDATLLAVRRLP